MTAETGRRDRREAGRHRMSAGGLRMVADGDGAWSLAQNLTRPSSHIGRVGALAVALGVGGMIVVPGIAMADLVDAPDPGGSVATGSARPAAVPGPASRKPRRATPSAAGTEAGIPPSPRDGSAPSASPSRRHAQRSVDPVDVGGTTFPPSSSSPSSTSSPTSPSALPSVPVPDPVSPAVLPDSVGADPPEIAASSTVLSAAPAAAEATAPAMTVNPAPGQLSGADPAAILGDGADPTAPLAVPLAWAGVAVSRRRAWGAAPLTPSTATVATVETVTPVAAEAVTIAETPRAAAASSGPDVGTIVAVIFGFEGVTALTSGIVDAVLASFPSWRSVSGDLTTAVNSALRSSGLSTVVDDVISDIVSNAEGAAADASAKLIFTLGLGFSIDDWLDEVSQSIGADVYNIALPRIVTDGYLDSFLRAAITNFLGNANIRTAIAGSITAGISGGNAQLSELLSPAVKATVDALNNTTITTGLGAFIPALDALLKPLYGPISQLAKSYVRAELGAYSTSSILPQWLTSNSSTLSAAINAAAGYVSTALEYVLGTRVIPTAIPGVQIPGYGSQFDPALGSVVKTFTDILLTSSASRSAISEMVVDALTSSLGPQWGPALRAVLTTTVAAVFDASPVYSGVGTALSTTISTFLGYSGVATALADTIGPLINQAANGSAINPDAIVGGLLGTSAVQQGLVSGIVAGFNPVLGEIASVFVGSLGAEPAQRAAIAAVVTDLLTSAVGPQIGGVLNAPVSLLVDNLLLISSYLPFSSGGLGAAIGTTINNFVGNAALMAPLVAAIGNTGDQLLNGTVDPAAILGGLIGDSGVQQALVSAVVTGIGPWLSDPTVVETLATSIGQLITTLVGDSSARDLIKTAVVGQVTALLGGGPGAAAVSGILGDAVAGFLAGTGIDSALGGTVRVAIASLVPGITSSGVFSPLITTAVQFASAVLNGVPQSDANSTALASLMGQSGLTSAVGSTVSEVLDTLLSDPAFASSIGSTATLALDQLAGTPLALGFLGGELTGLLSAQLPAGLGASTVPATVAAAVIGLLADADANGLSDALGSALTTLLAASGVATPISDIAGSFASAVLGGTDASTAGMTAIQSLSGNTDFTAAVGATVNALLLPLLSGSIFRRDVETAIATAIPPLFGDVSVRTLLGATVAGLIPVAGDIGVALNPAVGSLVSNLLASPAVVGALASGLGPALEGFLGAPGMADLLTAAVNSSVEQALSGSSITDALSGVIGSLSVNPNFVGRTADLVTAVLGSLLNGSGVIGALGSTAAAFVTQVVSDPRLGAGVGLQIQALVADQLGGLIGGVVGGAAGETVMGLLTDPVITARLASSVNDGVVALLSSPGFTDLITMVAGGLTTSALQGRSLPEVLSSTLTALGAEPMFTEAVRAAVTALVGPILGDQRVIGSVGSAVASLVMTLIDDPRVAPWVGDQIESAIANAVGGDIGAVLGGAVSDTVMGLLTNPAVDARLVSSIDALVVSLLSFPGFGDLITGLAGGLTTQVLQGQDVSALVPSVLAYLGADGTFTGAISSGLSAFLSPLLGDADVVQALGSSVASLVMQVLGDPLVAPWVGQELDSLVAVQVGGDLGQLLGSSISEIVVNLLSDPGVTATIVSALDSAVTTLLGAQGFGALIGTAGGNLAGGLLEGQPLIGDLFGVLGALGGNPMFEMTVNSTLAALLVPLLSDPELGDNLGASLMMVVPTLLGDPGLRMMIGTVVAGFIPGWIGGQIGAALANPVGDLVENLLADTALINPLAMGLGPAVAAFLGMPGVAGLLTGVVNRAADAALSGTPIIDALTGVLNELRADPEFDTEIGDLISAVVGPVLADPAVAPSLGPAVSTLVMQILDDPTIQGLVGEGVKTLIATQLPGGVGVALGTALSTAVVGLLADPGLSSQLGVAIGPALDALLGSSGVMPLIAGLAGEIVTEVLPNYSFANVVQVVIRLLPGLVADPIFDLALGTTVDAALSSLIGPALVPGVESLLSTVLAGVDDPGVVQWIGAQLDSGLVAALGGDLGRVLGPAVGGAVTSLLSDPGFNSGLVGSLNNTVNTLLSYPGLSDLLGGWAGPLVTQLLEGAPPAETLIAALEQLRSTPMFTGALSATVPALLDSLLGDADARAGLGRSAGAAVAIALDQIGLAIPVLQVAAAQATNAALTSLLEAPQIWQLANTAIIDLVEGSSITDVVTGLFDSVIAQNQLQSILGTAVGRGVGAVFGDNPVGQLTAVVATGAATIALSVLSGIARLTTGVPSQPNARTTLVDSGRYFQIDLVTGRLMPGSV